MVATKAARDAKRERQAGKKVRREELIIIEGVSRSEAQILNRAVRFAGLTTPQARLLLFIAHRIMETGRPPSNREMRQRFGYSSPNAVHDMIHRLVRSGKIAFDGTVARGIQLPGLKWLPVPETALVEIAEALASNE